MIPAPETPPTSISLQAKSAPDASAQAAAPTTAIAQNTAGTTLITCHANADFDAFAAMLAAGSGPVDRRLVGRRYAVALLGGAAVSALLMLAVLGVRPESIRFVPAGTPGAIPVEVEAETPLNEKTVTLVLTAGGREILVSRPAGSAGPTDRQAFIAIDTQAAMLFDRATGNRIAPADAPARKEALA